MAHFNRSEAFCVGYFLGIGVSIVAHLLLRIYG